MTKIQKKMIKKCNRIIDFNRLVKMKCLIESLKEFETQCVDRIRDNKAKIAKLTSIMTPESEFVHDICIFDHQRKLNSIKMKRSQKLRAKIFEKMNKEFPKNILDELKYDIFSKDFENIIIGYAVCNDWAITGIYHNTVTKETFTSSLLFNSEIDYFNPSFIFNDLIEKYRRNVAWDEDDEVVESSYCSFQKILPTVTDCAFETDDSQMKDYLSNYFGLELIGTVYKVIDVKHKFKQYFIDYLNRKLIEYDVDKVYSFSIMLSNAMSIITINKDIHIEANFNSHLND
jgi:hypothetical protein